MATGMEHYKAAEALLETCDQTWGLQAQANMIAAADVHARLAQVAIAAAETTFATPEAGAAWSSVIA